MTTAQAAPPRAPFELHSIHFDFPGGQAIHLREPATDQLIGATPEWATGRAPRTVAFVRGTTPQVRVIFRATPAADGEHLIGATGASVAVTETKVTLAFDPVSGLSRAVTFSFSGPLPNVIGVHSVSLDWYTRSADSQAHRLAGTSALDLCTTWRAMTPDGGQDLADWVYGPIVLWTSRWAAGAVDEKGICDAIISRVASSGIRYGLSVSSVREMILRRAGMCGIWYRMFQQMAHSQGVFVHRRAFLVHWRSMPNGEDRWCALVVRGSGLNQSAPTHPITEFHDHDGPLVAVATATLVDRVEARYRFWGLRGAWSDGHCVNFLEYGGRVYLYDACFGGGPFDVGDVLPPADFSVWGGRQLATIKAAYLDSAVDYMMGSLYNKGRFLRSSRRTSNSPESVGLTVRTAQIPETDGGMDGLSFYWAG